MSAQNTGVPRLLPEMNVNFRDIPSFTPQAPTQIEHLMSGLGQVFNGVLDQVNQLHAERVKLDAQEAGTKAGATPGFDAKKLPNDPTIASQAFRDAALQSFGSQLELDQAEKFNQFHLNYMQLPEDQRDPTQLQAQYEDYIKGVAGALPDDMKVPYMHMAINKANPVILQAHQDYLQGQQAKAQADNLAAVKVLKKQLLDNPLPHDDVSQKAYDTRLVQWNKAMDVAGMTASQKQLELMDLQNAAHKAVAEQKKQAFLTEFENAPDKVAYLGKFGKAKASDLGLDTESQNNIASVMEAKINHSEFLEKRNQQEFTFKQGLDLALQKKNIETKVEQGAISQVDIVNFSEKNKDHVSPEWVATQVSNLQKAQKAIFKENKSIDDLMTGQVTLNPDDPDTQKLVDKAIDRLTNTAVPIQGATVTGQYGGNRGDHAHGGIDLAAPAGTPIRAIRGGKVIYSGKANGFGNMVKVQLDDGFTMLVGHNASNNVKVGDRVEAGQMIATVGSQGHSSGPHGHLEIYNPQGKRINPQDYLNRPSNLAGADPEQVMQQIILKHGVVPTQYKNSLIASLHGTAQQQAQAADRYAWLQDNDIEIKGLTARDEGLLARISAEINRGVPAETAVKIARQALDPNNQNKIQGDAERVKKWLKQDANQLETVFADGWFKEQKPNIPIFGGVLDTAKADWRAFLMEAGAQTGGDLGSAIQLAKKKMQKIYGFSYVNGAKQFVKYPPERYYGVRGYTDEQNSEWIKKQFHKEFEKDLPKGVDSNTLMLIPHRLTYREAANGKPSYTVFYKNKDGRFVQLEDSKGEITFRPDPSVEIKRINAEQAKRLAAAKQKQIVDLRHQRADRVLNSPKNQAVTNDLMHPHNSLYH